MLVRSLTLTVTDPVVRSTVQSVLAKLRTMPQVTNLRKGAAGNRSSDERARKVAMRKPAGVSPAAAPSNDG